MITSTAVAKGPRRIVPVIFHGNEGHVNSVTHYYHFLFAAMVPLLEYHFQYKASGYYIETDIGPMKSLLCELPLNIVSFVGPERSKTKSDASTFRDHVLMPAYDSFLGDLFEDPHIPHLKKKTVVSIVEMFNGTIPPFIASLPSYDIVLVERTHREKYYEKIERNSSNQVSGALVRRINNHAALAAALSLRFGTQFASISFERTSIYYQFHIFSRAKLIIAQHGAAMSNILFMQSGAAVIEINPSVEYIDRLERVQLRKARLPRTHFQNLAKHIGIRHEHSNSQLVDDTGDVVVEDVLLLASRVMEEIEGTCSSAKVESLETGAMTAVISSSGCGLAGIEPTESPTQKILEPLAAAQTPVPAHENMAGGAAVTAAVAVTGTGTGLTPNDGESEGDHDRDKDEKLIDIGEAGDASTKRRRVGPVEVP